jgi:hypothetical protein
MKARQSIGGWLVGGLVVLTMVVASLVLGSMVSVAASPEDARVQPVPVPTPPAVHAAEAGDAAAGPALAFSQPEPAPTPPDSPASPRGQAIQATVLLLLGLSAFAAFALFLLRLGAGLPAEKMVPGMRQAPTACQEC